MKETTLESKLGTHSQNLKLIKFIAAMLVILSHSYVLSSVTKTTDFISSFNSNIVSIGSLGVIIFFFSSGFFITNSAHQYTFKQYFQKRIKRIFPPLVFVTGLTIFFMGVFISSLSCIEYFTNHETWRYLYNIILIPTYSLPGVFEELPYMNVVNGSLWTLPIEVLSYIAIFIATKVKLTNKNNFNLISLIIFILMIAVYNSNITIFIFIRKYMHTLFAFFMGSLYWVYKDKIILSYRWLLINLILLTIFICLGQSKIAFIVFFPYILIYISYMNFQCSDRVASLGKYSYGIYLVGFPIQQTFVYLWGGSMSVYLNFILTVPVSIILGWIISKLFD